MHAALPGVLHAVAGDGFLDWLEGLTVGEVMLGLVAVAAIAGWVKRKLWPTLRDLVLGLVDLVGAPARGNRPARPGLLSTVAQLVDDVASMRSEQATQGERLGRVEGVAAEAASAAAAGQQGVETLNHKVDALAAEQTQIRQTVEELRSGHGTDAPTHDTASSATAGQTGPTTAHPHIILPADGEDTLP